MRLTSLPLSLSSRFSLVIIDCTQGWQLRLLYYACCCAVVNLKIKNSVSAAGDSLHTWWWWRIGIFFITFRATRGSRALRFDQLRTVCIGHLDGTWRTWYLKKCELVVLVASPGSRAKRESRRAKLLIRNGWKIRRVCLCLCVSLCVSLPE